MTLRRPRELERVALYIRVAHSLRGRIADGEWVQGMQLPTINELARTYGVALITVRQAVALLAADGLVTSTRGRGTFVCAGVASVRDNTSLKSAINDRLELPPSCSISVLERTRTSTLPAFMKNAPEQRYTEYFAIKKLHQQEGEPFSLVIVYVAQHIYDRFPKNADAKAKIFRLVLDLGPFRLKRSHVELMVVYADHELANLLKCPALSAVIRIRTCRVDEHGKIALVTDSYYRADRFVYEIEEHDVELGLSDAVAMPTARGIKAATRKRQSARPRGRPG
jgi:GntR family transcriptional regulator